ncbi:MAG: rhomboid family intramembrane serine protease [Phycisphaerales bacterium]
MGIYDRDYVNRDRGIGSPGEPAGPRLIARLPGWSVNTWLIVINIAVHILAITVFASRTPNPLDGAFYEFGALTVEDAFQRLEVWRLLTFQFLHSPHSLTHLLFNMFGLWIFGPMVEQFLGRKRYLAFYLVCGLFGGLLFIILTLLGSVMQAPGLLPAAYTQPLVGASAGVFGVIVACAYISPKSEIMLLFPPIPMKMRTFAYGYVAIALISLLMGAQNAGGEAAHIGGALAGFIFIRKSHLLTDFFDVFGDSRQPRRGGKKKSRGSVYGNYKNAPGPHPDEIDKILQKVSQKGLASLSEKEKKTLAEASKHDP